MNYDVNQDFWKKKKLSNIPPLSSDERKKLGLTGPPTNRVGSKVDKSTWSKGDKSDTTTNGEKGKKVGKILDGAATAVKQFTQSRKVDYSGINKSSRGNVGESDLTEPGYSDYFARDNNGPV